MAQCSSTQITAGSFYNHQLGTRTLLVLNEQRNLSQFCDVILKVCGTQIFAHSNVLAAASPYFGSFLGIDGDFPRFFSQKAPQIIEIHIATKDEEHDGYGEAVRKVIEYMYTGQIILTTSLIGQIVEISRIMQMESLLLYCKQFQNGEHNNYPQDASTCTSGLKEIAHLMYGRSKTRKRCDASTEVDVSIFKRTECANNYNCQPSLGVLNSKIKDKEKATPFRKNIECPIIGETEVNNESKNAVEALSLNKASPPDQNEVSLVTEISEEHPAHQDSDINEKSDKVEQVCCKNLQTTDQQPKNLNSIVDFMSPTADDSTNQAISKSDRIVEDQSPAPDQAFEPHVGSTCTDIQSPETNRSLANVKDINLDEISDLVRFGDLTDQIKHKEPTHVLTAKRPRGRPRGRGKRRGPGRPRKMIKEDEESDIESDDFMEFLEQSSREEVPCESKTKSFEQSNNDQGVKDSTLRSGSLWTSCRKRSRPSQLKKDYVIHSLVKRNNSNKNKQVKGKQKNTSSLNFVCQSCDFITSVFRDYHQHMKKHPETDPRVLKCDRASCDFKTTRSREFSAHKHRHMIDELVCILCEEKFTTQADYDLHRKKHEGHCPYFCTECDSRFRTKAQLMAHKPKHQLEKPFVCAICLAGFKWKHALKNHMVTHSATKDHLCDECGYVTAHKSQLKAHMLIHTGFMFRCPYPHCSFQATKRQNLKYHMVTHTQEKPHQCEVCGQSFSLIKNMRRHMLLHTGARPFSCNVCGFSTTRYDKLKHHNQKLHSLKDSGSAMAQESSDTNQLVIKSSGNASHSLTVTEPHGDVQFFNQELNNINVELKTDQDTTYNYAEETLQTIAHLASNENIAEATIIHHQGSDGNIYPLITTVEFEDANGVKYELLPSNISG